MSALQNVVRLPTAAPKKVRQQRSRTKAADRKALIRFPTERVRHDFSDLIMDDARAMLEADKTAAMQIALAVFGTLSNSDRTKVVGKLAGLAMRNHAGAVGALAWVGYEMSSPSRRQELFDAAKWLQDNGVIQNG